MTNEEQREQMIQQIADMMRMNRVTFELKVKKRPQGIKVIYEVTQEHLNEMIRKAASKEKETTEL